MTFNKFLKLHKNENTIIGDIATDLLQDYYGKVPGIRAVRSHLKLLGVDDKVMKALEEAYKQYKSTCG